MRKKRAEKRITIPDPKFGDMVVARFINNIMIQGKKNLAQKKNTIFVAPYNRSCNLCGTENSVLLYVPQAN